MPADSSDPRTGPSEGPPQAMAQFGTHLAFLFGVAMSLFQIWVAFNPMNPMLLYPIHVGFALVIAFLLHPAGNLTIGGKRISPLLDLLLAGLAVASTIYFISQAETIIYRAGVRPTRLDTLFGTILILMVLEIARRTTGLALPILSVLFLLYARFGTLLPGTFGHRGYDWERIISYVTGLEGIFSIPVATSARFVYLFVLFSAFLGATGAGRFFIDFATSVAGSRRGGPAKIAIISSAMFGTISGSSAANVVATGSFTIPMMKGLGYRSQFAGAVEAVASTGGQIMPPIMGSAAFIMAEIVGIPYFQIALHATIPAILYFLAVYVMVDLEAAKIGLKGLPREHLPRTYSVITERGHLFLPVVCLLFALLVLKTSMVRAALWAIGSTLVVSLLRSETRMGPIKLSRCLNRGAVDALSLISACACAGLIIGILSLTGGGLKFAQSVVSLAGGYLLPTLVLTMLSLLILGMGLPTTACYLVCAAVAAPALTQFDVHPVTAHLFIFYFACISAITPPVALAAYAGAGIAQADPLEVGLNSVKLGIVAFIVPFMFIYGPALLGLGSVIAVIWSAITAILGCIVLGLGIQGFGFGLPLPASIRILLILAALFLIKPGVYTDMAGFGLLAVCAALGYRLRSRRAILRSPEPSPKDAKGETV